MIIFCKAGGKTKTGMRRGVGCAIFQASAVSVCFNYFVLRTDAYGRVANRLEFEFIVFS